MSKIYKYEKGEFKLIQEIKENPDLGEAIYVAVGDGHWSDCATHNEPAYPNGECDCGGIPPARIR